MKPLRLVLPFIFLFSITLVSAQNKEAAKYNDKIITKQHKITKGFLKLFKSFEKGTKEKMDSKRTKLLDLINASIAETKAMPDFDGDAELRDGAVDVFNFYKKSLETEYPRMIELIANRDRSEEDHKKLDAFAEKLIKEEEEIDKKFEDIQVAFAKKHGLGFKVR